MWIIAIIAAAVLVGIDQLTKYLALVNLKPIGSTTVVDGFLDLTFVENRGVAFGMFSGKKWFILLLTLCIVAFLVYYFVKMPRTKEYQWVRCAMVLVLARYFHTSSLQTIESTKGIIPPLLMALFPAALIILQPDLGTALMLLFTTGAIFFAVGVQVWKFAVVFIGGLVSMPIAWAFLHDYQRNRVLTFLDPERDPLGAGYHIIQSKIALGSGGVFGKGFLKGTQSHLNFLPEKHTDFIFTMLSEEFGMMGAVLIVVLNFLILAYSYSFALKSTSYFGKLVAIGLATNYFMYVFINISMVLGLIPVVGIPLPLISYGGTVMLSIMASFGIILSVHINRNVQIGKD